MLKVYSDSYCLTGRSRQSLFRRLSSPLVSGSAAAAWIGYSVSLLASDTTQK